MVPHGEFESAFTHDDGQPGQQQFVMKRIAAVAERCASGPTSRRAISERGAAPWRTDAKRMMKSWTAPRGRAEEDPESARQVPELRCQDRPINGPEAEIAAKWLPEQNELVGLK